MIDAGIVAAVLIIVVGGAMMVPVPNWLRQRIRSRLR